MQGEVRRGESMEGLCRAFEGMAEAVKTAYLSLPLVLTSAMALDWRVPCIREGSEVLAPPKLRHHP